MDIKIPKEIQIIGEGLIKNKYEAYLVGGCVRDILLGRKPKDWDIATDAKPEQIQELFEKSIYENAFGTVAVKTNSEEEVLKIVEITTFRKEGKYTDKRHPDDVKFAKTIEEDLARRDFTVNAMALNIKSEIRNPKSETNSKFQIPNSKFLLIDSYGGQVDIKNKIIRTVGEPRERFNEDALRLMRAVRLAVELGFKIEKETELAVIKEAGLLEMLAKERIRDEFVKIVMSSQFLQTNADSTRTYADTVFTTGAAQGIQMLEDLGLLKYIIPELREGIRCGQNKHHIYTVWEHNLRALDYAAEKRYSLEVRLAALFHDLGKPRTKKGQGIDSTFYNHEIVSAKMTAQIMARLRFPREVALKTIHLVRFHLFYYNVGEVTASGVRRFLARVGAENVQDFIKVREADRVGSGRPKAVPYKLRHLLFMIDKVKRDPVSPKMLAVNGDDVMRIAGISQSPKVGWILAVLLDEVLENPLKNRIKDLGLRIKELNNLQDRELEKLAKAAREKKEEFESGIEDEMKKKFYVK